MEGKIFTLKKWWELIEGSRLYISDELGLSLLEIF